MGYDGGTQKRHETRDSIFGHPDKVQTRELTIQYRVTAHLTEICGIFLWDNVGGKKLSWKWRKWRKHQRDAILQQ
jgi:hypothetical protein